MSRQIPTKNYQKNLRYKQRRPPFLKIKNLRFFKGLFCLLRVKSYSLNFLFVCLFFPQSFFRACFLRGQLVCAPFTTAFRASVTTCAIATATATAFFLFPNKHRRYPHERHRDDHENYNINRFHISPLFVTYFVAYLPRPFFIKR